MKIKGVGLPFSVHQSSCSNKVPTNFEWTEDDADIEVWMDYKIIEAIGIPISEGKKRYAWCCESKAIAPLLRQAFDNEELFNNIINSYDAVFTCEKELINRHEKIHFCFAGSNLPWISEYEIYDKSKLISFISSAKAMCYGHQLRHQLYEKIKESSTIKDNTIDVYGSIIGTSFGQKTGCHMKGYPGKQWHNKSEALNDYMFSVVMENDKYDIYFTEKITDCFATGTIPVYYGSKSIGEHFNTDGIIFLDEDIDMMYDAIQKLDSEIYYRKLDAVKDNFERVKNMQLADDMLFDKIT
jgi:hypothetical protein